MATFRMTAKRKEAIERVEANGGVFDTSIFANPITRIMSVDELIAFSNQNVIPDSISNSAFANNIVNIREALDIKQEKAKEKSFSEIEAEVKARFALMEEIVMSTAMGINSSLFLSGSAGVGKSTTVMNTIKSLDVAHKLVKGEVTGVSLFTLLYENRHEGSLLILDDSDSVFDDETKLNLLKACTDSTDERTVSWHSSRGVYDIDGNLIPSDFVFNGSIIFISNRDIYKEASSGSKMAVHFQALISRSFVLDLSLPTADYFIARIKDVLFNHMSDKYTVEIQNEIFNYMMDKKDKLRELSLRMVGKISIVMSTYGDLKWKEKADILLCKMN